MKTIKLGFLGFGTVGRGAYDILKMNAEKIKSQSDLTFETTKILVRNLDNPKLADIDKSLLTTDFKAVCESSDVDIVIEVLGGIEPAASYIKCALQNGKHVVSANKAAIAANLTELLDIANKNHVRFLFEASVGGGIPILTAIRNPLAANQFTRVEGILNGTTNYILTKMSKEGLSYETALKSAQELGFAEADPTADVEGIDAANKLSILIKLMFDKYIKPNEIPTTGISKVSVEDIKTATEKNHTIKLIACASVENGNLTYSVKPTSLPNEHPLTDISNEFNAIYLTGNAVGEVMLSGKGAGALPTGSAVCGDIIAIAKHVR
ncbi:MAG: homoserine dehydrogenase [Eubacteriales bacterium]